MSYTFSSLDLIVIASFGISALFIIAANLRFIHKSARGVTKMPIFFGAFPLAFAIGELFEYTEKVTEIGIFGLLEKLITLLGTIILVMVLWMHLKGMIYQEEDFKEQKPVKPGKRRWKKLS